jgi:GR25 family glycosyltransferase involved in LPS biosynthesis
MLIPPHSATFDTDRPSTVAAYINGLSPGNPILLDAYDARAMAAFIEDRTVLVLVKRLSIRTALHRGNPTTTGSRNGLEVGRPAKISINSQACDGVGNSAIIDGWIGVDLSTFDLSSATDWSFYLQDSSVSRLLISHHVVEQTGCGGGFGAWLSDVVDNAIDYVTEDGRVIVEVVSLVPEEGWSGECSIEVTDDRLVRVHGESYYDDELLNEFPRGHIMAFAIKRPPKVPRKRDDESALGVDGTILINLDRRPDRLEAMLSSLSSLGVPAHQVDRLPATDGNTLNLVNDPFLADLFSLDKWAYGEAKYNPYQDHSYRKNVLGCALSHYRAWASVFEHGNREKERRGLNAGDMNYGEAAPLYMVLEDDVVFNEELMRSEWRVIVEKLRYNGEWDILYLGLLDDGWDVYSSAPIIPGVVKMSKEMRWSGAGAFAVVMRPRAAKKLLDLANERGIMQPVDWFIMEAIGEGNIVAYKCDPGLARSPEGEGRDSDNNQDYPQARLVMLREKMERERDGAADELGMVQEIYFMTPERGQCVKEGDSVSVTLNMIVIEDAPVFVEKSRDSKICFKLVMVGGGSGKGVVSTDAQRKSFRLEGSSEEELLCIGWDEGEVKLEGLSEGRYLLGGRMVGLVGDEGTGGGGERHQWSVDFAVGECKARTCVLMESGARVCRDN